MGTHLSNPLYGPPQPPSPTTPSSPSHGYISGLVPTPPEASQVPSECEDWYADFCEKAYCVPHRDGQNMIICYPELRDKFWVRNSRGRDGWGIKRIRGAYEILERGEGCGRIVKYLSTLPSKQGVVVERLYPGPLDSLPELPSMTVPIPATQSPEDKIMLALYFRWALQILSALRYMHSHSVYFVAFDSNNIWIRSDFSIAMTGFICATSSEIEGEYHRDAAAEIRLRREENAEWERKTGRKNDCPDGHPVDVNESNVELGFWDEGEWSCREDFYFKRPKRHESVQQDLHYWATFVWRLMTNEFSASSPTRKGELWNPNCPLEGGVVDTSFGTYKSLSKEYQELEEERLGWIFVKAWKKGYRSVDEVIEDVRRVAEKIGLDVVGDEVDIGRSWEDVLEVENGKVEWKKPGLREKAKLGLRDGDEVKKDTAKRREEKA